MTYVFDIDGTICSNTLGDYKSASPFIIFLTARGMGRTNNDRDKSHELFYDLTKKQLSNWNVKYHKLFMGKPSGDIYIDDKGERDENFFDTTD